MVVNEDWEDSDEWNDYDNLSPDDEEYEEDEEQTVADTVTVAQPKASECQDDRKDLDSEANAEEVAISIFQADESGTLQQVGFGQSKKSEHVLLDSKPSNQNDFPMRGWGHRFQAPAPLLGMGFPSTPPQPLEPGGSQVFSGDMFSGVNTNNDLEYDGILPNGMILKEEYFSSVKKVTPNGNKRFTTKVKQEISTVSPCSVSSLS